METDPIMKMTANIILSIDMLEAQSKIEFLVIWGITVKEIKSKINQV